MAAHGATGAVVCFALTTSFEFDLEATEVGGILDDLDVAHCFSGKRRRWGGMQGGEVTDGLNGDWSDAGGWIEKHKRRLAQGALIA